VIGYDGVNIKYEKKKSFRESLAIVSRWRSLAQYGTDINLPQSLRPEGDFTFYGGSTSSIV